MRARRQHSGRRPRTCCARSTLIERAARLRVSAAIMRVIVVGLGVQGHKRRRVAGADFVAAVDPVNAEARVPARSRTCRSTSYDAALVCIPDEPKVELLDLPARRTASTCWSRSRCGRRDDGDIVALEALARAQGRRLLHRLQPSLRAAFRAHARPDRARASSGRIYRCRMFYGNGTARLVRDSAWRDQGAGVLPDLGSHLLDTCRFWFGDIGDGLQRVSARTLREPRARPCRHRRRDAAQPRSSWR